VIAAHVSNRLFALAPELARIGGALGLHVASGTGAEPPGQGNNPGRFASEWVLLSADPDALAQAARAAGLHPLTASGDHRPWSDGYVNLLRAIR
jgi:hypothetical protein